MPLKSKHHRHLHRAHENQDNAFKKPKPLPKRSLNGALILGVLGLVLAAGIFFSAGENMYFWVLLILAIILTANAILLRFNFSTPFLLPFVITMVKTKHTINFIYSIAHHSKWFEKICLVGMFLGFGITGVDYWYGRKLGGWKRVALLSLSTVILGVIFEFGIKFLFSVPLFAPLYIPCLVGFLFLGFGGMTFALMLGYGLLSLNGAFFGQQYCPSVAPVIPGAPIPGLGTVIPLIAWVSLALVLIIHEFSHGILMAYYKEKIKSVGLLLAGIFPIGAFVEQDDKTFNKLDDKKSLMVLSAGSASNLFSIAIAVILMVAIGFASQPLATSFNAEYNKAYNGVKVLSVEDTVSFCGTTVPAPAKGKFLAGDIINSINGVDVNSLSGINRAILSSSGDLNFSILRLSDKNVLVPASVSLTPYLFKDLNLKKVGVVFAALPTGYEMDGGIVASETIVQMILQILLFWAILSFAAGSFNYLPSDPFDGGRMGKIILAPYFAFMGLNKKETQVLIGRIFMWLLVIALVLNMVPYLTMI
ncbi:Peptidase family M50 [uncultured archaeon]|nr:Peptidase family M50 [uncultured archaeon]